MLTQYTLKQRKWQRELENFISQGENIGLNKLSHVKKFKIYIHKHFTDLYIVDICFRLHANIEWTATRIDTKVNGI